MFEALLETHCKRIAHAGKAGIAGTFYVHARIPGQLLDVVSRSSSACRNSYPLFKSQGRKRRSAYAENAAGSRFVAFYLAFRPTGGASGAAASSMSPSLEQRVYDAFVDIWDREDLWVTIDRANLNPPKRIKGNPDGFIHWDVDTSLRPLPIGVQGVLSLQKQDGDVGGFQCVPYLFEHFEEWVSTQPVDDGCVQVSSICSPTGRSPGDQEKGMAIARDDVISVLGPVDDAVIVEIAASGASLDELREAWAWLNEDEALMGSGRPLPGTRVAFLIELLDSYDDELE
jgi:hypothetical protein